MSINSFLETWRFADASQSFNHAAGDAFLSASDSTSTRSATRNVSLQKLGVKRVSWLPGLAFLFILLEAGALPCLAVTTVTAFTAPPTQPDPCSPVTPIKTPIAFIQLGVTTNQTGASWAVTNWTASPYLWSWNPTSNAWINSGGTSQDFQLMPALDQTTATFTQSDTAKPQSVYASAIIDYVYLSIHTTIPTSIPTIEIDDSGGGCSSCNLNSSAPALGTANVLNKQGPYAKFNLGAFSYAQTAGTLMLNGSGMANSAALSTPAVLSVPFVRTNTAANVTVMTNSTTGFIQQVNTPQGLVNVAVVNAYQYQLQMFYSINVITNSGSLYTTNGPAFLTWTIANPNGSTNANLLTLTENGNGVTNLQYTYAWTNITGTNQWVLTDSGSNRTAMSWAVANSTNSAITNLYSSVLSSNSIVKMVQKTYVPMTSSSVMLMAQEMDGSGSATNLTALPTTAPIWSNRSTTPMETGLLMFSTLTTA